MSHLSSPFSLRQKGMQRRGGLRQMSGKTGTGKHHPARFGRCVARHLVAGIAFLAALAALNPPAALAAEQRLRIIERSSDMSVGTVRVAQGTSETMKLDAAFADLVVGDPDVADVVPLTDKSLYVLGKKLGRTSVSVYNKDKGLLGVLEVEVSYDTRALTDELRKRLPQARIDVSSINGRLHLSGTVPDAVTQDRALTLAKQFGAEVVSSLNIGRSQQVMLEVRFVEASRSAGRELGVQVDNLTGADFSFNSGLPSLQSGNSPFGTVVGTLLSGGISADVIVRALEDRNLGRRLAEPNLIALSGDTASFLAGGEFPYPVATGTGGQISVEFKKFGVGLSFTPTVLKDGLINLKIEPEVSELDFTATVSVGGVDVPSLIVRRASTTIELKDGQSFAIAGLLQSTNAALTSQLPWIGQIPVVGALFRSSSFQQRETDLVIIVTPRLVKPVPPGLALRTPLDHTKRTNDAEFFLNGGAEKANRADADVETTGSLPAANATSGHILQLTPKGTNRGAR